MEMVYRFRIKPGKAGAFVAWDKAQREADTPTAEGWSYKGTWMVVQGLGDYDAESRFEVDDYAALGNQQPAEAMEANIEFFTEYVDDRFPMRTTLMKSVDDVYVPEGF